MPYKCKFCNKVFKTEKGFNNHNCEYKQRYENFHQLAYDIWKLYMINSHISISKNEETNKMKFIKSTSLYKFFVSFSKWALEVSIPNIPMYIQFCINNGLTYKVWNTEQTHRRFLSWFINEQEHSLIAIERSKEFLEKEKIDIHTISSHRLYLYLLFGSVSKKYLYSLGIDPKTILDTQQITDLGDLL